LPRSAAHIIGVLGKQPFIDFTLHVHIERGPIFTVKANVLFFDKKPSAKTPATKEVWVYDLRSERSFSLRQNPIGPADLTDFIRCYHADDRTVHKETMQFRRFTYTEIVARDKANLDLHWQQETYATQGETPQALMKKILKDLEEAMREFAAAESEILR
jgi:type I restriction enzyme M protein